jgi:hypothetical protein
MANIIAKKFHGLTIQLFCFIFFEKKGKAVAESWIFQGDNNLQHPFIQHPFIQHPFFQHPFFLKSDAEIFKNIHALDNSKVNQLIPFYWFPTDQSSSSSSLVCCDRFRTRELTKHSTRKPFEKKCNTLSKKVYL